MKNNCIEWENEFWIKRLYDIWLNLEIVLGGKPICRIYLIHFEAERNCQVS